MAQACSTSFASERSWKVTTTSFSAARSDLQALIQHIADYGGACSERWLEFSGEAIRGFDGFTPASASAWRQRR